MRLVEWLNQNVLWGVPMLLLMACCGLYLGRKTGWGIYRHPAYTVKTLADTLLGRNSAGSGGITPFQAIATALAGTVGTGNIIGVAVAIRMGGPGSIFWMWVAALLGMIIKYAEVTLAVEYHIKTPDMGYAGGPMYYINNGLKMGRMAVWFCVAAIVSSFGIGSSVQSNSIAQGMDMIFNMPHYITGIATAFLAALILIGGIRRIARVAQVLVPVMTFIYIAGAAAVLAFNISEIPIVLRIIVEDAFNTSAAAGGITGFGIMRACRIGFARGIFTNEAGLGSAPIAHAAANVRHPSQQGVLGAFEVFFDTLVMCTVTALVIMVSGAWKNMELDGLEIAQAAFDSVLPSQLGGYIVTAGVILFAFATIPAWYYYGEQCVCFLYRYFTKSKDALSTMSIHDSNGIIIYKYVYIIMIFLGAVIRLDAVWELADFFNGMMAVPNLIALCLLAPKVGKLTKEYPDKSV